MWCCLPRTVWLLGCRKVSSLSSRTTLDVTITRKHIRTTRKRNRRLKETPHHAGPRRATPNLHNFIFKFRGQTRSFFRVFCGCTRFPFSVIFFSILPLVEGLSCFQLITNFFLPVASNSSHELEPTMLRTFCGHTSDHHSIWLPARVTSFSDGRCLQTRRVDDGGTKNGRLSGEAPNFPTRNVSKEEEMFVHNPRVIAHL